IMPEINFKRISSSDTFLIELIAKWYADEWKLPEEKTIERLSNFEKGNVVFQVVAEMNGIPIATGGIYTHVGLLDREPKFSIHRHWLALMYSLPEMRGRGLGAKLCSYIIDEARRENISEIYLFTDTAESLYKRMGWKVAEQLQIGEREITVMNLGHL
ncbi:MAG: GNAT family N-acetyltransferase, partial [Bacteroidia bacterium]